MSGSTRRTVESSIRSISQSFSNISDLRFRVRSTISDAILSSNDEFETYYIRDGDRAEISLFEPIRSSNDDRDPQGIGKSNRTTIDTIAFTEISDQERIGWASGLRMARPAIPQPVIVDQSSKFKKKTSNDVGEIAATRSNISAIRSLLEIYPLPRLSEHVEDLSRQLDTLESSIAELESELYSISKPITNSSVDLKKKFDKGKSKESRKRKKEDLKEQIQREQLEILALTDLRDEKRGELNRMTEQEATPKKLKRMMSPIKPLISTTPKVDNQAIFSRTESLRRSILRAKSPRLRSNKLNEDNLQGTPTPKSMTHKMLERSLNKLRASSVNRKTQEEPIREQSSPVRIESKDDEEEVFREIASAEDVKKGFGDNEKSSVSGSIQDSRKGEEEGREGQEVEKFMLDSSRLEAIERLNEAFWKSASVLSFIFQEDPKLQQQIQKGEKIEYKSTMEHIRRLVKMNIEVRVPAGHLIESILYLELFKSLSNHRVGEEKDEMMIVVEARKDDKNGWCVPLDPMRFRLIESCKKLGLDEGLSRTCLYFLVSRRIVRIERDVSPFSICIC
ncbi:expressed protein [Phakopsora pachyrhizi]|uniref:Expressed protein n=1 Tax=Phakopsora pachyrhizi TaxID=170000 RepID=A0AAV0B516_PHAPC|nr:expressed protein [Phakopsora pachyrhizi]